MQVVTIEITERCPCQCKACYSPQKGKEMTLSDFKLIVNKLPFNLNAFTISGGEPFTHKSLLRMCKYCTDNLIKPILFTSGAYKINVEKYKPYISRLDITIRHPSVLDDKIKGVPGTYDRAIDALYQCKKQEVPAAIHWLVDAQNWHNFGDMYTVAENTKAELQVLRYLPYDGDFERAMRNVQWEDFCKQIHDLKQVRISYPSKYSYSQCMAGINRMHIKVDGGVTPCIYIRKTNIGNIIRDCYPSVRERLESWRLANMKEKRCLALKEMKPKMVEQKQ